MASATFKPIAKEHGKSNDSLDKAKDAGHDAMDKVKEAGQEAMDKVREAGQEAMGKAREAVGSVGEMASQAACAATKRANDLTAAAGHEVKAAADALRQKAPHEGFAGRASQVVADTLQGGGQYLEDAKMTGVVQDVAEVIKTHPIPTMLICLGIGYCVGRAMKD